MLPAASSDISVVYGALTTEITGAPPEALNLHSSLADVVELVKTVNKFPDGSINNALASSYPLVPMYVAQITAAFEGLKRTSIPLRVPVKELSHALPDAIFEVLAATPERYTDEASATRSEVPMSIVSSFVPPKAVAHDLTPAEVNLARM